jgi:hypothetical protein
MLEQIRHYGSILLIPRFESPLTNMPHFLEATLHVQSIGFSIPSVDVAKQAFQFRDLICRNVVPYFED